MLESVRQEFPGLRLMADANGAYTLADRERLKLLDRFYLMMLEQPLAYDDLLDHARLQQELETPIARMLVKGELRDGDTASVDVKDGRVIVVPVVTGERPVSTR